MHFNNVGKFLFERKKMKALKTLTQVLQPVLEKTGLIKKEPPKEPDPVTDILLKEKALQYLNDDLYNIRIEFIKKDGSTRWILCTLAENSIPEKSRPKKGPNVGFNQGLSDEVCRVFDLEKKAWRSFRWNSVKSIDVRSSDSEFNNSTTVESEPENAIN